MPPQSRTETADTFGDLLRSHRQRRGLTQQECALAAGLGVRTLRDLENGRAQPRRATAGLLAVALELHGTARAEFLTAARRPVAAGQPDWVMHLPPPPELLGRDPELSELDAILRQAALVSLVGVAGVGKTSLALTLAHRVGGRHPGGVAGIQVTEGTSTAETLAVVAAVFGVARASDLPGRLSGGPALLMVDAIERNFEPVVAAVAWLRSHATGLRIIVTGRRPTGIDGELAWSVGPLATPPEGHATLGEISGYPAVALFLDRLRAVDHPQVRPEQAADLAELVRRLDGLPLALELAASRGRILRLDEILDRYRDRVLDLGDPQATLRDAVASSYALLDDVHRAVLRALAQFRYRWSVRLAEALLAEAPSTSGVDDFVPVLDRLEALGLVGVRGTGPVRFRLLDVVREFALEQATPQEALATRVAYARVVADFAAAVAPDLVGATQTDAVARLDDLAGDLSSALSAAARDDPPTALRLAAALPRWWRLRGRDRDGRDWLERLLAAKENKNADPRVRAFALLGVGMLAAEHGTAEGTRPGMVEALTIFSRLDDVTGQLAAHTQLCSLDMAQGRYAQAREHGEAALALANRHGRTRDVVVAQTNLTWHDIRAGDLAAARRRLTTVRRLAAEVGEARLAALAQANLAEVARLDGRHQEAVQLGRQAIPLLERLGDPRHTRRVLGIIALAQAQDRQSEAARATLAQLTPDGTTALAEAYLALAEHDAAGAAEWFDSAEQELTGQADVRDVVEALVGLASCASGARREAALDRLRQLCDRSAVTLLPEERARLQAELR